MTSADGSYKQTVWIAKDSHMPVKEKDLAVYGKKRVTMVTTTEMVP
jgi:hypothetical protein